MIILRAGLVGCLAAIINPKAEVYDDRTEAYTHKAVLRFRSDAISIATRIPFDKVTVRKAVFHSKAGFVNWNPRLANLYSAKVSDGVYERSINNLDPVQRWVAPEDFHQQMMSVLKDRIKWSADIKEAIYSTSCPVVSTIPMQEVQAMVHEKPLITDKAESPAIYVSTAKVKNCNVHYTIYYPDMPSVYRATIEKNKLIVEGIGRISDTEMGVVLSSFGIMCEFDEVNLKQEFGKMPIVNNEERLQSILNLTVNHNIYSLGRTATCRSILMDDCYKDIKKIQQMIQTPSYKKQLGELV